MVARVRRAALRAGRACPRRACRPTTTRAARDAGRLAQRRARAPGRACAVLHVDSQLSDGRRRSSAASLTLRAEVALDGLAPDRRRRRGGVRRGRRRRPAHRHRDGVAEAGRGRSTAPSRFEGDVPLRAHRRVRLHRAGAAARTTCWPPRPSSASSPPPDLPPRRSPPRVVRVSRRYVVATRGQLRCGGAQLAFRRTERGWVGSRRDHRGRTAVGAGRRRASTGPGSPRSCEWLPSAGRDIDDLRRAVALVGRRPRTRSGRPSPSGSACAGTTAPTAALADAVDARRPLVPGRHPELRRARAVPAVRRRRRTPSPSCSPARTARAPSSPGRELRAEVAAVRAALVGARGRRRATGSPRCCPNAPEALVAMLATASLGAVWSSCSPDFGAARGRRPLHPDRAGRCCSPSTATATAARRFDIRATVERAARRSCRRCARPCSCPTSTRHATLPDVAALGRAASPPPASSAFEPVPFDAPDVDPVLLGHHRAAQADRARPRRHPRSST